MVFNLTVQALALKSKAHLSMFVRIHNRPQIVDRLHTQRL